jgi:hypothetical protein
MKGTILYHVAGLNVPAHLKTKTHITILSHTVHEGKRNISVVHEGNNTIPAHSNIKPHNPVV